MKYRDKVKKTLRFVFCLGILFEISGCAYSFTNLAFKRPYGAHKLAIDAVYDTTGEVLPHQILWSELFRSFAARGKMRITSVADADIVLRPHLYIAKQVPEGVGLWGEAQKDSFKGDDIYTVADPKKAFKNLLTAGAFTSQQSLSFAVHFDAWNIHNGGQVFDRTYGGSILYGSFINSTSSARFLAAEEEGHANFRKVARDIAEKVVVDFHL